MCEVLGTQNSVPKPRWSGTNRELQHPSLRSKCFRDLRRRPEPPRERSSAAPERPLVVGVADGDLAPEPMRAGEQRVPQTQSGSLPEAQYMEWRRHVHGGQPRLLGRGAMGVPSHVSCCRPGSKPSATKGVAKRLGHALTSRGSVARGESRGRSVLEDSYERSVSLDLTAHALAARTAAQPRKLDYVHR